MEIKSSVAQDIEYSNGDASVEIHYKNDEFSFAVLSVPSSTRFARMSIENAYDFLDLADIVARVKTDLMEMLSSSGDNGSETPNERD